MLINNISLTVYITWPQHVGIYLRYWNDFVGCIGINCSHSIVLYFNKNIDHNNNNDDIDSLYSLLLENLFIIYSQIYLYAVGHE